MKKIFKNQSKGITLIALVVTIVVLLILAAVSIQMLGGENGIIKQAQNAKEETIIGEEKEQVEMAYVSAAINKIGNTVTEQEFQKELNQSVGENKTKVTTNSDKTFNVLFIETSHNYNVDKGKVTKSNGEMEYAGLIINRDTEGVTFTKSDRTTPGNPDSLEVGDIVIYGDYEYHYNQEYYNNPFGTGWNNNEEQDGWGVKVLDISKDSYSELCGMIYGKNLRNMNYTFSRASIIVAPQIPVGVIDMGGTFQWCYNMTTAPTIPSSVRSIDYIFSSNSNLTGVITINANPEEYYNWIDGGKAITLKGTSTMLETLAEGYSYITVSK